MINGSEIKEIPHFVEVVSGGETPRNSFCEEKKITGEESYDKQNYNVYAPNCEEASSHILLLFL